MSEQFLLRLSSIVSFMLEEEAKKLGISKTKLIEEVVDEFLSPSGLEVVPVGPPGKSSTARELIELLKRSGKSVLGVVRVVSPIKDEDDSYLITYGTVLQDMVYAAVGCVDTRSIEGYNAYWEFESFLSSQGIKSATVQGSRLIRTLPEDTVKFASLSALGKAFLWGKLLLLGGPDFSWKEEHSHEVWAGSDVYIIACSYPNPDADPEKTSGVGYFYVFKKSVWPQNVFLSNRAEGRCVVSFQEGYKTAQIEEFLLDWRGQNCWNTGLAETLLGIIENHCAELGCKIIRVERNAFLDNEYSTYAEPVLTMKGYHRGVHGLEKVLSSRPAEENRKNKIVSIYCSRVGAPGVTRFALDLISLAEMLKDRIVGAIRIDYRNAYGRKFTYALVVRPAGEKCGYFWVPYTSRSTTDYSGEGGSGHRRFEAALKELSIPLKSVALGTEDCDEEDVLVKEARKIAGGCY